MMKKLFPKSFVLIVIGQIISLLGNTILRFALPLYLLSQTDSVLLFGMVSACSFLPVILLSPIGGILADRVNKRNIMVILDFATAGITLLFTLLLGKSDLTCLILIMLLLLQGIQSIYQPAVQASVPLFMTGEDLMKGNAAINLVSSLSALIGPIAGGAIYSFFGIYPILYVSILCFFLSAVMEIFIQMPFEKRETKKGMLAIAFSDLKESITFITKKQPVIQKVALIMASANLFFSSLILIGLPVMITRMLGFSEGEANRLYGYAEGAVAAGSLIGGLLAGILSSYLKVEKSYLLLMLAAAALLPMGACFFFSVTGMAAYGIILVCCFLMLIAATLFSIRMLSVLQQMTPEFLLGKVISCVMCLCTCTQPLGQAVYGILFDLLEKHIYILFFAAFFITGIIALLGKRVFAAIHQSSTESRT